jgi:hypothetical protein
LTAAQGIWITSISEIDVWIAENAKIHAVLLVDERLGAAEQTDAGGQSEWAAAVRAEAAVLVDRLSGG